MLDSFLAFSRHSSLILLFMVGIASTSYSQEVFSPLSVQGVGELQPYGQVRAIGMGRLSTAYSEPYSFNLVNPASMAWINFTLADVAVYGGTNSLSTPSAESNFLNGGLGHFAIALPFSSRHNFVAVVGAKPYALSGYAARVEHPSGNRYESHMFEGNLSTAFASLSKGFVLKGYGKKALDTLGKNNTTYHRSVLGIGATGGFLFGTHNLQREIGHPDSVEIPYTRNFEEYLTRGFQYTIGAHYKHTIITGLDSSVIDLGLTFGNAGSAQVDFRRYAVSYYVQGNAVTVPDTVIPRQTELTNMQLPYQFSVGGMYTIPYKLKVGFEFKYQLWQNTSIPWAATPNYNYMEIGIGGGYMFNEPFAAEKAYLSKLEYRAGLRYFNSYHQFNDQQVSGIGMNFGLGFPIMSSAISMLNIGVELQRMGSHSTTILQDDDLRFYLGVTIGEKWFQRMQID